jgi:hypothetical protein
MSKSPPPVPVYLLHVRIAHIDPPIWRDLLVPWAGGHLHAFRSGKASYTDTRRDADSGRAEESRFRISDVLPRVGMKATYEYDFGDCWRHEICVKEIMAVVGWTGAQCVGGARACPPEDCGGVPGYEELLTALARKNHARHGELSAWLTSYRRRLASLDARFRGPYDAEAFDLAAASRAVAGASRIGGAS